MWVEARILMLFPVVLPEFCRGCGKWEAEVAREHRDVLVDFVHRGRGAAARLWRMSGGVSVWRGGSRLRI